jgi:hypothetical protein
MEDIPARDTQVRVLYKQETVLIWTVEPIFITNQKKIREYLTFTKPTLDDLEWLREMAAAASDFSNQLVHGFSFQIDKEDD